jgi:Arc/MetJ family transcription regulator
MGIRKTSLAIDEDLLEAARVVLDTRTVRETIEQALMAVLKAQARREEVAAWVQMDGMDLDNERVMAGAWGE